MSIQSVTGELPFRPHQSALGVNSTNVQLPSVGLSDDDSSTLIGTPTSSREATIFGDDDEYSDISEALQGPAASPVATLAPKDDNDRSLIGYEAHCEDWLFHKRPDDAALNITYGAQPRKAFSSGLPEDWKKVRMFLAPRTQETLERDRNDLAKQEGNEDALAWLLWRQKLKTEAKCDHIEFILPAISGASTPVTLRPSSEFQEGKVKYGSGEASFELRHSVEVELDDLISYKPLKASVNHEHFPSGRIVPIIRTIFGSVKELLAHIDRLAHVEPSAYADRSCPGGPKVRQWLIGQQLGLHSDICLHKPTLSLSPT